MTPSDDLSPPRRPIFFPVVIATVFLTIIGLTVGFMLGERRNGQNGDERPDNRANSSTGVSAPAAPGPTRASGQECPPETRQKAEELGFPADLRQALRITTNRDTTVWICRDPNGALYYQSKTAGPDEPLVQGETGLFLENVRQTGEQSFEVNSHDGNVFRINTERLRVDFKETGKIEEYDVIEVG